MSTAATPPIDRNDATDPQKVIYRWQPTYPEGHELAGQPMGGEQTVEYDGSAEDLGRKMQEKNNLIQAEMRNLRRQVVVSKPADNEEEIPATATKASTFHAFQPRNLTPEEKLRLAKAFTDPEQIESAADLLLEARFGAKAGQISRLDETITKNYFTGQGQEFRRRHPELDWRVTEAADPKARRSGCPTVDSLLGWCDARDLAHTVENLELALARLKKAGLLSDAPITAQGGPGEIAPGSETDGPADSGRDESQPAKRQVVRSSALTSRNSTPARPQVQRGAPSLADIEGLSVDQIKAKPAEWKRQGLLVIRRLPKEDVDRLIKKIGPKIDALG